MNDRISHELEITKQQLTVCKLQDSLLEKIEMRLHAMKKIAQYASEHELTLVERTQQNKELEEHQPIYLSVYKDKSSVRKLYESLGFQFINEYDADWELIYRKR